MKKYLSLFIVLAFMFSFSIARADYHRAELQAQIKEQREAFKTNIDADRANLKTRLEARKAEFKDATPAKREAIRAEIKTERETFRSQLETKRAEFKQEIKVRKAEFKDAKIEKKAEFRSKAKKMTGERFEAAVRNLERAQSRVTTVIEKLNADNRDTTIATESFTLSKQKLEEAKVKIAELNALIPATDEKVTDEIFAQIKLEARETKDLLKESHQALVDAVKSLKGLKTGEEADENETE